MRTFSTGEYPKIPVVAARHRPRLFCLNDALTGGSGISAEEIPRFGQTDLASEDVMLLDTFAEVYVWIGAESSANEKKEAQGVAAKYLEACGRPADVPITVVGLL
jgi:gelsolin